MSPYINGSQEEEPLYSPLERTRSQFKSLIKGNTLCTGLALTEFQQHAQNVTFSSDHDEILFPCPLQQAETMSILKAVEACWAACIADLRYVEEKPGKRKIEINLERSARSLLGTYLYKIGGYEKKEVLKNLRDKLKDTDLFKTHNNAYRRGSTNIYETKVAGEYFHLHGSMNATPALNMIGLPAFNPDLTTEAEIVATVESAVRKFTVAELEALNAGVKQAGTTVNTRAAFLTTPYGAEINSKPRWSVEALETSTPPLPFPDSSDHSSILKGVRVIEMCRVIAGPTICRILTEYGADVIKVTSPNHSDVVLFQVEANMGKHTTELDLRSAGGKQKFEELLATADVLVDGYRTGALSRLGFGPAEVEVLARKRGKGYVYVSENCFGYGLQVDRPGWQQVADAVTGVAWAQGTFMGAGEPCIPPFPMSDYGTGSMGAIAALEALYRRARYGGSYRAKCCLVHYDNLLFQLGQYPDDVQKSLRQKFDGGFFQLRHADSTDSFSGEALKKMKEVAPWFFSGEDRWGQTWLSQMYGGIEVRCLRPVSNVEGVDMGYRRATRPNGTDEPTWDGWEVEYPIGEA